MGDGTVHLPWPLALRQPVCAPEGKGERLRHGGDQPGGIPLCTGSAAGAAALPSCRRVISRTLLLLQSLLLFFNWVESGNLASPFCTNEGFIMQGPSSLNWTNAAPTPLSSLIFIVEVSMETG